MQNSKQKNQAVINEAPFPNCFAKEFLVISRGNGVWLEDTAGKKYLDFAGGIAVNAFGYGREDLARVAFEQMKKLIHISNLYTTEPALELARKMTGNKFQAVQFLSSGAEANETALKYARLYSLRKKGEGNHRLLCFKNSFHGRTMGALSVTPIAKYQAPFLPLIPGIEVLSYNDVRALEETLDGTFAGVIVEVIQGEGGLECMTPGFARTLNRFCRRHDVILIADEIQTGLARTGSFYASEAVGLDPDIITLAKPLAAGLPLSAALIPERVNALIHLGEHGTTFGGGPVTTAVALKVWERLSDRDFIRRVKEKGEYLRESLEKLKRSFSFLGEIKGRGLLMGIEVPQAEEGSDLLRGLIKAAREEGLLILGSALNMLRFAPPLVISEEEIKTGLEMVKRVFAKHGAEIQYSGGK